MTPNTTPRSQRTTPQRPLAASLVAALGLLFAVAVHAATDSETITINATVGNVTDIQLIDDSATGPAQSLGYIGTIRILANDPDGFTLTITSQESGVLLRGGGVETIPYTFYFVEEAGALGPAVPLNFPLTQPQAVQLTAPLTSTFNTAVAPTDVTYSMNIEMGPFIGMNAGVYSDVITIDLVDL